MEAHFIAPWAAVAIALGGCTASPSLSAVPDSPKGPPESSATYAPKPVASPAVASPAVASAAVASPATAPAGATALPSSSETADKMGASIDRTGFATRYAYFHPASWEDLPGWREDSVADALAAFRRSCIALQRKVPWDEVCAHAKAFDSVNDDVVRDFFEREFVLYEIQSSDRTPEGVITGYYEPLIEGNRSRRGAFVYPVYATPADLLTLDVRRIPRQLRGENVAARIQGRTVVPVLDGSGPYVIDVGDLESDIRDKRLRVRLEGKRVVPYPTRARIESEGLPRARVLAWVDNPAALYSMQIQGSGKIRLPGGRILRLAYAEQNGHPFTPPVTKRGGSNGIRILTRGLDIELPDGEDGPEDKMVSPQNDPSTRGGGSGAPKGLRGAEPLSPDVEQLVEALASGRSIGDHRTPGQPPPATKATGSDDAAGGKGSSKAESSPSPSNSESASGDQRPENETVAAMNFPQPSAAMQVAISADPSYVFFREIPDGPGGPIGALGVPLTAGRSVAVDPRTTPLGFPVFVSTTRPGRAGQLNRLVMAQDTGGAIRGAVRADYFWGFGAEAYAKAARMKDLGRMWLLLPREIQIAARDQPLRTRGIGTRSEAECLVPDPELCVEDP